MGKAPSVSRLKNDVTMAHEGRHANKKVASLTQGDLEWLRGGKFR
jgi:hypothetical protein